MELELNTESSQGYIGRFLALYLHKNALAGEVRLVDKVLPQLAWLAPEFVEACSQDKFMQADASREQSLLKIFTRSNGKEWDYVFNCGGETHFSQDESVYKARSLDLCLILGRECARRKISAFVEFGTGIVYKPASSSIISSGGCTESSTIKPWLKMAKYKVMSEEGLQKLSKEAALRYTVLRLPHVYGEYDIGFLARGLCLARVYQSKGEEMKWLYGKDLRVNTVHVEDVAVAAWKAARWCAGVKPDDPELKNGRVFNIVDKGDTSQLLLSNLIASQFHIVTGFTSPIISTFAKLNLSTVVDDVNEDILQPWADLLSAAKITRPGPISPWMEKELLKDSDLCLNGSRAERVLGWRPEKPKLDEEGVRGVVDSYKRMNWWP